MLRSRRSLRRLSHRSLRRRSLQSLRSLAVQAASETLHNEERSFVNDEYAELHSEINRIAGASEFNGIRLLNGRTQPLEEIVNLQVGANGDGNDTITVVLADIDTTTLNLDTFTMVNSAGASSAIEDIDTALSTVTRFRGMIGAWTNRIDSAISGMTSYVENLEAAASRIVDADFAVETAEMTRLQIMQQAGIASLAQARNMHTGVVALLS